MLNLYLQYAALVVCIPSATLKLALLIRSPQSQLSQTSDPIRKNNFTNP